MDKRLHKIAFIEVVVLLVVWQILATLQWIPEYLSSPMVVGKELFAMIMSGDLFSNAAASLYRSIIGFLLVAVVGIVLGIAAGYFKPIGTFFTPIVDVLNPIPKIALLPILMVWFGISDTTRVLLIFLTAFFPCFIATQDGVHGVKQVYVWAAQNMGASRIQILWKIILPASLPKIFDGLRVSLGLTFVMMFSSEMIGSSNGLGLGFMILTADMAGRTDLMFVSIFVIALLGFLFDRILLAVRARLLWWSENRG
ncbi:ABC transporter permease [Brevibacillus choshinensis]|uniref:ABC transporter permease n=1 Tax=Brevibacillus choshinensis TaxID=54911 RepID=UPI002E2441D9|nr:ABC transporter permease [Brevibacillus choshinensis]